MVVGHQATIGRAYGAPEWPMSKGFGQILEVFNGGTGGRAAWINTILNAPFIQGRCSSGRKGHFRAERQGKPPRLHQASPGSVKAPGLPTRYSGALKVPMLGIMVPSRLGQKPVRSSLGVLGGLLLRLWNRGQSDASIAKAKGAAGRVR
jgi:hypothetical protein